MIDSVNIKTISDFLRKQSILLGPHVTLQVAQSIPELVLSEKNEVINIKGDPKVAYDKLLAAFSELAGDVIKKLAAV